MYCSKCGNKIEEGTQFCNKCGNKIEINTEIEEKNRDGKSKSQCSIWVIIVGIIIGIVCVKGLATIIQNSQQRTFNKYRESISCIEFIEKI